MDVSAAGGIYLRKTYKKSSTCPVLGFARDKKNGPLPASRCL
jgi:hypothetical protein